MFDLESMMEKARQNAPRDENGNYVSTVNLARLQATAEKLDQIMIAEEERRQELSRQFAVQAEKLETASRVFGIVHTMTAGTGATVTAPKTARFRKRAKTL